MTCYDRVTENLPLGKSTDFVASLLALMHIGTMDGDGHHWVTKESVQLRLCEDGIVLVEINPLVIQMPEHARDNLQAAISLCGGVRRPLLVDVRGTRPLRADTRKIYMDPDVSKSFSRLAMITLKGRISQLMVNLYFKVAQHTIPTRLFLCPDEARQWLVIPD